MRCFILSSFDDCSEIRWKYAQQTNICIGNVDWWRSTINKLKKKKHWGYRIEEMRQTVCIPFDNTDPKCARCPVFTSIDRENDWQFIGINVVRINRMPLVICDDQIDNHHFFYHSTASSLLRIHSNVHYKLLCIHTIFNFTLKLKLYLRRSPENLLFF